MAHNDLCLVMQVFKSMADVASGDALYNKYSEVSEEDGGWLSLRDIVLARKMPRRMLVQPLTVIQGTETPHKAGFLNWPHNSMLAKLEEFISFDSRE